MNGADVLRVAAVQMTTGSDSAANVAVAARLIAQAAEAGARFVVLPEKWPLLQATSTDPPQLLDGEWIAAAREWALRFDVAILAGSVLERVPSGGRASNTSVLVGPDGEVAAIYRKLHLFDVDVAGTTYRESTETLAGEDIVVADILGHTIGMSVCYDLRFPELYRALVDRGAEILAVPSAFTAVTGTVHWHVLLRARAIENQCFVIAANQVGRHANGTESYGHSLIIDPWGRILAEVEGGEGVIVADLDFAELRRIRASLPALAHRRKDIV